MSDLRNTESSCSVCGHIIVERSHIPYFPAISKDIVGPGSRNTATERNRQTLGYHCSYCGIEYHKLPQTWEANNDNNICDRTVNDGVQ